MKSLFAESTEHHQNPLMWEELLFPNYKPWNMSMYIDNTYVNWLPIRLASFPRLFLRLIGFALDKQTLGVSLQGNREVGGSLSRSGPVHVSAVARHNCWSFVPVVCVCVCLSCWAFITIGPQRWQRYEWWIVKMWCVLAKIDDGWVSLGNQTKGWETENHGAKDRAEGGAQTMALSADRTRHHDVT